MMAFLKVDMGAARIHYLAASYPCLPPSTSMMCIAPPWGATAIQVYFLLTLIEHAHVFGADNDEPNGAQTLNWCCGTTSVHAGLAKGSVVHDQFHIATVSSTTGATTSPQ